MKKYIIALSMLAVGFIGCQNEAQKKEVPEKTAKVVDSLKILNGEFIYVDSAAVLKGNDFIYGVEIDSMAKVLAAQVDSLKRNEFDMVPVILEGTVKQNEQKEGWDEILTIKKIIKVSKPISDPAIRIEGEGTK